MPRYYFDIDDGINFIRDTDGVELPDSAAAQAEAMNTLPLIASDQTADNRMRDVVVSVRGESNAVLYRATLSISCKRPN